MAGAFTTLLFQKGAMEAKASFHHRGRSRQIFGSAKDFCPNSRNLPEKSYVQFCLQIFSNKDHKDLVWCDLKKWSSCVFLQTLGIIFWSQTTLGAIYTRIFMDFSQVFRKIKLLGVAIAPPQPPPPTQLLYITVS